MSEKPESCALFPYNPHTPGVSNPTLQGHYRGYRGIVRVYLGLHRDNGKESGNYHLELRHGRRNGDLCKP